MTARHLHAVAEQAPASTPLPVAVTSAVEADFEAQDNALSITCPRCGVAPGEQCVNPLTANSPLRVAHWQRIPKPDKENS